MRTLLGTLALATFVVSGSGCYISKQCCDPCGGMRYRCTEFGFSRIFGGCNRGCDCGHGCDCTTQAAPCVGPCDTVYEPGCELPAAGCDYGYAPAYEFAPQYDGGPQPTFAPGHQPGQSAPSAPTPMPMPAGNETTGWQPSTAIHRVHHVQYPTR